MNDNVTTASTESSTESSSTVTVSDTSSSTITTETSTETSSSTDTSSGSPSESSSDSTSDSTSESTSDSSTDSTTGSTTTPPFNEVEYCQGLNSTGRYPIPNDTVCTRRQLCGITVQLHCGEALFRCGYQNLCNRKAYIAGCTN